MKLKEEEREQQIERYLPLIHSLVRRYEGRGIPKEDLLQAGRIGLNRAIEKYDASGGCSFLSFARRWINHCVERAMWRKTLANGVSHRDYQLLRRAIAIRDKLTKELAREPTVEEL